MKQFSYQIEDPNGMHARPAGAFATFAKRFLSDVRVSLNGKDADGKRLLSLMGLGATVGNTLQISVYGEDEDEAARALEEFCRNQLKGYAPKE